MQAQRIAQAVNEGADAIAHLLLRRGQGHGRDQRRGRARRGRDDVRQRRAAVEAVRVLRRRRRQDRAHAVMAELAAQMGGKGKVAILPGNQNAPNLRKRVEGVREEAAKHPGISIVGVFNQHRDAAGRGGRGDARATTPTPRSRAGRWWAAGRSSRATLLDELDPKRMKIVAVDALPVQLPYVEKGLAPVLLAQPVYLWGHDQRARRSSTSWSSRSRSPARLPMELVRVSKENLGDLGAPAEGLGLHGRAGEVPPDARVALSEVDRGRIASAPPIVRFEAGHEALPGRGGPERRLLRGRARLVPRALRRERGGQEHAREDPGRHLRRPTGGGSSSTARPVRFASPRDALARRHRAWCHQEPPSAAT